MDFDVNDIMSLSGRELRKIIRESLLLAARDSLNFTQAELRHIWDATGAADIPVTGTPTWWTSQPSLPTQPNKANTQTIVLTLLRCEDSVVRARVQRALHRRIPALRTPTPRPQRVATSPESSKSVQLVITAGNILKLLPPEVQNRIEECKVSEEAMTLKISLKE